MGLDRWGRVLCWGLTGVLGVASLMRGSQQPWAALIVTTGVLGLWALAFLCAVWTGSPPLLVSRSDRVLLLGFVWLVLRLPSAPPDALSAFLVVLGCLACFTLTRALARSGLTLLLVTRLCAIGGLVALIGLLQVFGVMGHGWWEPPQFVAATFVNHNHFAAFLELLLPLGLALWLAARLAAPQRFLAAVCCTLMAIGFLVSASRGAWLSLTMAAAVGLGWRGIWGRRIGWNWRAAVVCALAASAIVFLASQPPIWMRGMSLLDAPNDPSVKMRQAIWLASWDVARASPLIGHGFGSFALIFPRYRPAGLYQQVHYAFNDYAQLGSELGLVGLALLAWIALLLVTRIGRLVRLSETPWKRAIGLGGLIGLGSLALHSLVDYPCRIPAVGFALAAVSGLLMGIGYHADPVPLHVVSLSSRRGVVRWAASLLVLAGVWASVGPLTRLTVADLWAHRGFAKRQAQQLEEAVGSYQHATRWAPSQSAYHRELAESLQQRAWRSRSPERRGFLNAAVEAYRKALALVPLEARSAHGLGETLIALGDVAEADRWLAQAVTLDPNNPLYWKDWAELNLLRGEADKAAEAFRRAARLANPYEFFPSVFAMLDDPNAFIQRGESALLLGRLALAETAFLIAQRFDPAHPAAHVGLALCALNRGDLQVAQQMAASIHEPLMQAKWLAGLAQYHLRQGHLAQAQAALETSLKLDDASVLARHLQLVLTSDQQDDVRYAEGVRHLLALNRPPVFVRAEDAHEAMVVWEPEHGAYHEGYWRQDGWVLSTNGVIQQSLIVPPGRIHFLVTASGTKARGMGPIMAVSWNGRPILTTEVPRESLATYSVGTEVRPGETLLTVGFVNDGYDVLSQEDRNLKVEQVIARWAPR